MPSESVSEPETPFDGEDTIEWVIEFLSEQPPYAAIGKVIHAGADLEHGLITLCRHYGLAHKAIFRKSMRERVEWLREYTPADGDMLDRVLPAVQKRNLLAHGMWIRVRNQRAFIKHDKDDAENLRGEIATEQSLEEWRAELQDVADFMTSHHLTVRASVAE